MDSVHPNLLKAWKIHNENSMCFIFDFVYPARQFERGTKRTDDGPTPTHGPPPYDELTEGDEDNDLVQYAPPIVS
jgi:hypothetical protein